MNSDSGGSEILKVETFRTVKYTTLAGNVNKLSIYFVQQ
jgi:hypothetical protein